MNEFLLILEDQKIQPNFWCSEEYFLKAGFRLKRFWDLTFITDEDWLVFPPVSCFEGCWKGDTDSTFTKFPVEDFQGIWSDFIGYSLQCDLLNEGWEKKFLDLEYIYDPEEFLYMAGSKWEVFRKNSRKFPNRVGKSLEYRNVGEGEITTGLTDLLARWVGSKGDSEEIHDDEVLLRYLLEGEHRKVLLVDGEPWGVNIWDYNYKFINFRFCICRNEPYLSEYMRKLFYTDPVILNSGKLVNDGGVLDNPKLKFFKGKLNPLFVNERFTWERRKV